MNERQLRLALKPSAPLAAAIAAAHGIAAASVAVVMPGAAGALVATGIAALGLIAAWRQALQRSSASVVALELQGREATVFLAGGASFPAEVAQRRYVSRFAVVISLRRPVRRTILVTPDMLGGDSFRKLRMWALWGRLPATSGGAAAAVAEKQLPA